MNGLLPHGISGLNARMKRQIEELIHEYDSIESLFRFEENFCKPPAADPSWFIIGDVQSVDCQGGRWRALANDANPTSAFVQVQRCFGIAGSSGAQADPPMSLTVRGFVVPSAIPGQVVHPFGFVDLAHNVMILAVALDSGDGLKWIILIENGVDPTVMVPTGKPATTSCEGAQILNLTVTKTAVTLTVNGSWFATPLPFPGLLAHLFGIASAAIQQVPGAIGETHIDFVSGEQGYICLEDPGTNPQVTGSGWIQSQSNRRGDDLTTNDTVNWVEVTSVTMTTGDRSLIAWAAVSSENDTAGEENLFRVVVDGNPISEAAGGTELPNPGTPQGVPILMEKLSVPAGPHTIALQMKVTGGTGSINAGSKPEKENAVLLVAEVAS